MEEQDALVLWKLCLSLVMVLLKGWAFQLVTQGIAHHFPAFHAFNYEDSVCTAWMLRFALYAVRFDK